MNKGDKIKVRTEKYVGYDNRIHAKWNIEIPPPIKYSESEACISPEEYEAFGRYWLKPVNLLNTMDMTIETVPFRLAALYSHHCKIVTNKVYPIYDVNNSMIGYVDNDIMHYTDDYLKSNRCYLQLVKRHSSGYVSTTLWILLGIWIIYSKFFK